MLSLINAECRKQPIMLIVIMLNVVMLSVFKLSVVVPCQQVGRSISKLRLKELIKRLH